MSGEIRPRRSWKAVASLVCGLLSFVPLVSIPAVVLGHLALWSIRRSSGRVGGGQFAVTGLVFGYLGVLWTVILVHVWLSPMPFEDAGPYGYGPAELRTLCSAALIYQATYSSGYPPSLEALGPSAGNTTSCDHAGLIDPVLVTGLKSGYRFTYVPRTADEDRPKLFAEARKHGCMVPGVSAFAVTAEPVSSARHWPSCFCDQTGVMRMSKHGPATANSPPIE